MMAIPEMYLMMAILETYLMIFSRFVVYMHKIETLTYFFSGVINTTLVHIVNNERIKD
jgi:hypothetical protein